MDLLSTQRLIQRYNHKEWTEEFDDIVKEYPLTIHVNDQEFATIVCSPEYLEEMVVGFLASEGMLRIHEQDVKKIIIDEEKGFAYVTLTKDHVASQDFYSKRFIGSCCGKSRQSFYFQNDVKTAKTSMTKTTIKAERCLALMKQVQQDSEVFLATGGVHNAAIATQDDIIVTRADIGRHNALDKLFGHCLINRVAVRDKVLLFSGRISSEVLLKAAKMGVGIMLSKSAPTDLALAMADELNMTTAGFIRGERMNVYTHAHRIVR
ncbi:formate dehydrogenase accessory sulfurtransferase FdhD [Halalkalibacter urbisdiaboli]|uniref:formate dehydrogenase accessory sulfurtransferase FdhD n=1 Tax=Halalkalibacter urbisdiaboli TaxID=1960589 RepID=UPI000B44DAC0|nr:formate dehydrogenase accessory sulfurtransferase FdhD [Halalkalibacter urbisdiaboli]